MINKLNTVKTFLCVAMFLTAFLAAVLPVYSFEYTAQTSTWYMRSDSHTANNVTGYKLSETQSATHTYNGRTKTGTYTTYYGVRVWIVFPNGQLEELTSGTPVAVVSRSSDGSGLQSANWTCPGYLNIVDAGDRLEPTCNFCHV